MLQKKKQITLFLLFSYQYSCCIYSSIRDKLLCLQEGKKKQIFSENSDFRSTYFMFCFVCISYLETQLMRETC